ncbi:MAG TPA: hypothetical protein V6C72_19215 [Chroococcales cyanobacterium]
MQIRLGNKQDEASVRQIVARAHSAPPAHLDESGKTESPGDFLLLDLTGQDKDLVNIEANYIGHDGTFLVAEQDRKVVGFALARSKPGPESDSVCLLRRLMVERPVDGFELSIEELITKLIEKVESFACNLDYRILQVDLGGAAPDMETVLSRLNYQKSATEEGVFYARQLP